MFDPKNTITVKNIWNSLGTFYSKYSSESKEVIEAYWSALFNGLEGLYHDKDSAQLLDDPLNSNGFIEDSYSELNINTRELIRFGQNNYGLNLSKNYFSVPVLSGVYTNAVLYENTDYILSGVDTLLFTNLSKLQTLLGLDNYTNDLGYFTTLSGVDTLVFSSVSGLTGFYTEADSYNLYKNVDYAVSGNSINFLNLKALQIFLNAESEVLYKIQALEISPFTFNFYLPQLNPDGYDVSENLIAARKYAPYLYDYLNTNQKNKSIIYAQAIWQLCMGISYYKKKGPTLQNIKNSLNFLYNLPFSYKSGIINNIVNLGGDVKLLSIEHSRIFDTRDWALNYTYNTSTVEILPNISGNISSISFDYPNNLVTVSGIIQYYIPSGLPLAVVSGQAVTRFMFLTSGIGVYDYINNPTVISGLTSFSTNPEEYYSTLYLDNKLSILNLNYDSDYITFYINNVIPKGLIIKSGISSF